MSQSNDEDPKEWARRAASDPLALQQFLNYVERLIHGKVFDALRDRHMAEDITQETLLTIVSRTNELGDLESPVGWCIRIGYYKAINYLRSPEGRLKITLPPKDLEAFVQAKAEVADEIVEDKLRQLLECFEELLITLPEKLRLVLQFMRADYRYQQIAEKLGIPLGTVKGRAATIRKRAQEMDCLDENV
jgi:RNA polymerase sigma-70 factor (ECF subfamily)